MKRALIDGAWRTLSSAFLRVGGSWKRITRCYVRVGGAWKEAGRYVLPLTVTADPLTPFSVDTGTCTSTAIPSGGAAPFTYSWAFLSGDGGVVASPTSATTDFYFYGTSVFRCTVNDSSGQTATVDVTATSIFIGSPF